MITVLNALFDIAFMLIQEVFKLLFAIVVELVPARRNTAYTAEFGEAAKQLRKDGDGFYIGSWSTCAKEANSHLICFGGSGSKKSTSICFPTLLQSHGCSEVVHDCSRELFNGTARHKYNNGYRVFVLDYDTVHRSERFNVLEKCQSETEVYRVANVLTKNAYPGSSYDYWAQSAEDVIGFFAVVLFTRARPYANLGNVAHCLEVFSYDPEAIDRWIVQKGDAALTRKYKSLVATPEKTLQCTLSTARTILSIYTVPAFGTLTGTDTIDFSLFRKEKCILYLCGSPASSSLCRGISACLFDAFFSYLLKELPPPGSLDVRFMIDEASTMNMGKALTQVLALGRKYGISVATLWQDYNQIQHLFGEHEAANILANSKLKVFMPSGQPLATCTMLSQLLGKYSSFEDGHEKIRELLTPQEIFQLKKVLVLNGNSKPLLLSPAPYFENRRLLQLTRQPIYEVPETPADPLQLITF